MDKMHEEHIFERIMIIFVGLACIQFFVCALWGAEGAAGCMIAIVTLISLLVALAICFVLYYVLRQIFLMLKNGLSLLTRRQRARNRLAQIKRRIAMRDAAREAARQGVYR